MTFPKPHLTLLSSLLAFGYAALADQHSAKEEVFRLYRNSVVGPVHMATFDVSGERPLHNKKNCELVAKLLKEAHWPGTTPFWRQKQEEVSP